MPDKDMNLDPNHPISEKEIVEKYQLIDSTLDKMEG